MLFLQRRASQSYLGVSLVFSEKKKDITLYTIEKGGEGGTLTTLYSLTTILFDIGYGIKMVCFA